MKLPYPPDAAKQARQILASGLSASLAVSAAIVILLTACGGGTGNGNPVGVIVNTQSTGLTLHGTAASGLAIAGATVNAKCRNAAGTALTAADGSYEMSIPAAGALPCLLEVSNALDGRLLHAIATNTGIINLTPLTEMLSTRLMRSKMSVIFNATGSGPDFDAITMTVTSDNIKTAQAEISKVLSGMLDTSAVSNFYSTPLKAASSSNPGGGDAQDRLFDTINLNLSPSMYEALLSMLANTSSDQLLVFGKPGCLYYNSGSPPIPCAGIGLWENSPRIVVTPAAVMLTPGAKFSFTADINYPPNIDYFRQPVKWTLREADAGSISLNGEYVATSKPGSYHVIAQREDYPSLTSSTLVVIATQQTDFIPSLTVESNAVSVMPGNTLKLNVRSSYSPTTFYKRQPVSWSLIENDGGSIDQQGSYIAPKKIGTYHIKVQRDDFPSIYVVLEVLVNYPPD